MKFSIIIPVYNREEVISKCLESVLQQTYKDYEVVIIDDGSKDGTADICNQFVKSDSRFKYFYQQNSGVSAARNKGVAIAKGEFIVFLDSDDKYSDTYLQEFDALINSYPGFDNYWCCYQTVDAEGKYLTSNTLKDHTKEVVFESKANIMQLHFMALWNKAFRRRVVIDNKIIMPDNLSLGEDLLFNLHYLDVTRPEIIICNKALYCYTKSLNGTLDSKYRSDIKDIYDTIDSEILSYIKKWQLSEEQFKLYYTLVFNKQEAILYNTYRSENTMSKREKRKYNNRILKSPKFKEALTKSNHNIHPLYRLAYKSGQWAFIRFLDKLNKIKAKIFK